MTATDVANAVRSQNIEAALGQIGQAPMNRSQAFQLPLTTLGRLSAPEQFGDIIVKVGENRLDPAGRGSAMAPAGGMDVAGSGLGSQLQNGPGATSDLAGTGTSGSTGSTTSVIPTINTGITVSGGGGSSGMYAAANALISP